MSYHRKRPALAGPAVTEGPMWYRAMGGVTSTPRPYRVSRALAPTLGSLGNDTPGPTTLSDPTLDPQWRAEVLAQLRAGVLTMQKGELQKWLQIAATVMIPVSAAIWRAIFRSGRATSDSVTG